MQVYCILPLIGLIVVSVGGGRRIQGFQPPVQVTRRRSIVVNNNNNENNVDNSSNNNDNNNREPVYDIEAALVRLPWETLEALNQNPVLNLSSRDQSIEGFSLQLKNTSGPSIPDDAGEDDWKLGQYWKETKIALQQKEGGMGYSSEVVDSFLEKCPQLLRLGPNTVLRTADFIIREFGISYLASEPRLLSYREDQVQYGLEFLSTMMMTTDAKPICQKSTRLLLSGIDGGIQEKAVSTALGAAGAATTKASQTIAGDAMMAIQALQQQQQQKRTK